MIRAIVRGHSVTMDPESFAWSGAPAELLEELKFATAAAQCARSMPVFDVANTIAEDAVARLGGHLVERDPIDPDDLNLVV